MLRQKTRWYTVFETEQQLLDLLATKNTIVQRTMFGDVLFVKAKNGLHAFKNKCPHQHKPLKDCWTEGDYVVCPFHRYHFSIENGRGHGMCLQKYRLRIQDGAVQVGKETWSLF